MNIKLNFYLCILLFTGCKTRNFKSESNSILPNDIESCKEQIKSALIKKYHVADLKPNEFDIQFDCSEAQLITSLDMEMKNSVLFFQQLNKIADKFPVPLVKQTFDILNPYCRSDNEIYGPFCMAGDISSAKYITLNQSLITTLPDTLLAISQALSGENKVDFVQIVLNLPQFKTNKIDGVILASFIGLDDNGVQTNRLKANLLFQKRYEDYALLFPYLSQFSQFPLPGVDSPNLSLSKILFATRTGKATVPALQDSAVQTYKAYAGVYTGCQHALLKTPKNFALQESYGVGYMYQAIKLRQSFGKPWEEFLKDAARYDASGKETGYLIQTGSAYGYDLCKS